MEHGDGSQMGGTSREGCLEPPAEDIFMIVTKMEIQVVRIIARLLSSLNMAMAKQHLADEGVRAGDGDNDQVLTEEIIYVRPTEG